jgi:hypothetical protein
MCLFQEKKEAFGVGVDLYITCRKSYRGSIYLIRPKNFSDDDYQKHIASCAEVCKTRCEAKRQIMCTEIDRRGVAYVDSVNKKVNRRLKKFKAPCLQKAKIHSY